MHTWPRDLFPMYHGCNIKRSSPDNPGDRGGVADMVVVRGSDDAAEAIGEDVSGPGGVAAEEGGLVFSGVDGPVMDSVRGVNVVGADAVPAAGARV